MNGLSPVAIAAKQQNRAVDPSKSVWVSASAGTGKTKVLTDRVLALMLNGTAPQRILCLTFTKAAAAEMANRIAADLSKWVTLDDDALAANLTNLLDHTPEDDDLTVARRLFARVLETPGGMNIQTIHAFCQSVLRRFHWKQAWRRTLICSTTKTLSRFWTQPKTPSSPGPIMAVTNN